MRRGTVLNLRRFKLLEMLKNNKILVLLCICFSLGIIIGTVVYSFESDAVIKMASNRFERFTDIRINGTFGSVFISSLFSLLLFLIAVYISGTSMLGIVLVPLIVFFRGFYDGSLSAFLYSEFQLKGIALNAVLIIPPSILFIIGFIYASQQSINFSWTIARLALPHTSPINLFLYFKSYCTHYSLILITVLLSALTDAAVSRFFLPFFQI